MEVKTRTKNVNGRQANPLRPLDTESAVINTASVTIRTLTLGKKQN